MDGGIPQKLNSYYVTVEITEYVHVSYCVEAADVTSASAAGEQLAKDAFETETVKVLKVKKA